MKAGYKQTEFGEIPEDWDVQKFSDSFLIYAGGDVPKGSLSQFQTDKYCNPIYANAIQKRGLYGYTELYRSKGNAITVTARGTLGHAEYRAEPFFPIVRLLVLEPNGSLDPRFTTYAINDRVEFAIESTGVPQLTAPQIGQYSIAAPADVDEQKAIADALSDVDALIGSLEKLIAKKRDMKTATMQQLLTGKKRMPGFGGEWPELQLSEFTTMRGGAGFPLGLQGDVFSKTPFFKVSDFNHPENATFMRRSNNYLSEERISQYGYKLIPENSIVIAKIGAAVFLERKRILDRKSLIDNNMMALTFETPVANYRFLHQLLLTVKLSDLVSTTALPSLSASDVGALRIKLPSLEEQAAIADVLISMDEEIDFLEKRLTKTKAIKQGMMQELLTGRTRLV